MRLHRSNVLAAFAMSGAAALAMSVGSFAQQPPQAGAPGGAPGGRGGGRGGVAPALFGVVDSNKDGSVTRDEFKVSFDRLFSQWDSGVNGSVTQAQIAAGVTAAFPAPQAPAPEGACGGRSSNPQVPCPADVEKMIAALPDKAPAQPRQARKVLVLGRAAGFVHSSIPLAARTVDELGKKTGAWATAITYDAAQITPENLKQYDVLVLDSTTGAFLDDPNDPAATETRKKALLDFVRGGKGLVGIHAATDSYHRRETADQTGGGPAAAGGGGRRGGGRGAGGFGPGAVLAPVLMAQGDADADQKLTRAEMTSVADKWFDVLDPQKTGAIARADFATRFTAIIPVPAPAAAQTAQAAPQGPDGQIGTWPEFNSMIGGFFKYHWNDPQEITYKIDDPKSPLTTMFKGAPLVVKDETYTFGMNTYSRKNLRVLTSVDYSKMSDVDKAKESYPRPDHDYALSWIRRDGNGRVFYMAHGHHERNYAVKPLLEHLLAGIQYAAGDLKADDSPSAK
jgi:type 1 glutamine amidotransferase